MSRALSVGLLAPVIARDPDDRGAGAESLRRSQTRRAHLLLALAVTTLLGCAVSGREAGERRTANVITLEELNRGPRTNALDVVQTLRPRWLQARGPTTFEAGRETPVMVYVDGTRAGGPSALRVLPVQTIESMRYLTPQEASSRYGFDHTNGAILVTTRVGTTPNPRR